MRAVFVLGTFEYDAVKNGDVLTNYTYNLLREVADELGLEATIVFCDQDFLHAGKLKQHLSLDEIRKERPRVLTEIGDFRADIIFCFGPVATTCIFDKGNIVEGDMLRRPHYPLGEGTPPVYVTFGVENMRYRPGLAQWVRLDVDAAINGVRQTEWGNYQIIVPGSKEWSPAPMELHTRVNGGYVWPPTDISAIGFDLETYPALSPWVPNSRIRMAVISKSVGQAWVIQATPDSEFPYWVYQLLEDPNIMKCGSNVKFDALWMRRFGCEVVNMWDTSTHEHIIDESNPRKDLKSLTFKYVPKLGDYSYEHRKMVKARTTKEQDGWAMVRDEEMYQYAGADGESSIGTALAQMDIIDQLGLRRPANLMEQLYPVLCEMEFNGCCIDIEANRNLDSLYQDKIIALRTEIVKYLGPINLNSTDQLAESLKAKVPHINLSLREMKKVMSDLEDDDTSTKREVLERESHKHPVIEKVLEYRKYKARHGTFIDGIYKKHAVQVGGQYYIHPNFNPSVVETYRLSSTHPNGQNFPKRKDDEDSLFTVKRQFISRFSGGSILEADQSQLEIRVAAWLSRDKKMIAAVESGEDIHRAMGAQLLEKPVEKVTDDERYDCKRQTFLILYGGGEYKLARDAKIPRAKAAKLIKDYFAAFVQLKEYIDKTHADVIKSLQIETPFGFRRRLAKPDKWFSRDGFSILRQAFNTTVQNTAAALMYCSMVYIYHEMRDLKLKSKLILQVHDSLVFDVYPGEEEQIKFLCKEAMENPRIFAKFGINFDVPLKADVLIGTNWGIIGE